MTLWIHMQPWHKVHWLNGRVLIKQRYTGEYLCHRCHWVVRWLCNWVSAWCSDAPDTLCYSRSRRASSPFDQIIPMVTEANRPTVRATCPELF